MSHLPTSKPSDRFPDPLWEPVTTAAYHQIPKVITDRLEELYNTRDADRVKWGNHYYKRDLPDIAMIESAVSTCITVIVQQERKKKTKAAAV